MYLIDADIYAESILVFSYWIGFNISHFRERVAQIIGPKEEMAAEAISEVLIHSHFFGSFILKFCAAFKILGESFEWETVLYNFEC